MSAERVERVVTALRAKPVPGKANEWLAHCPAHADSRPSLSIKVERNGKVLLNCRSGGCTADSIRMAAGLMWSDLMPSEKPDYSTAKPQIVETYGYRDELSEVIFEVLRFEPGFHGEKKTFPQRRSDGEGHWVWGLDAGEYCRDWEGNWRKPNGKTSPGAQRKQFGDTRRVLYNLPELLTSAATSETVYIPEGEKDVNNLRRWNLISTCNPGGAGKWRSDYNEQLRGRDVVILPDNDEPGRKHRDLVGAQLAGKARSVRVLELPGLPPKGDVSDWIQLGGTVAEFLRLASAAVDWVPPDPSAIAPGQIVKTEGEAPPEEWTDPVIFGDYRLPPFPTNRLPAWIGAYVSALAETTQTPEDMAGVLSLSACSTAVAKVATVDCGNWYEPLNIYCVVTMPPASRKSAVVSAIIKPIELYERETNQIFKQEIAEKQTERDILAGRLQKAKTEAAAASKKKAQIERDELEDEAFALARELDQMIVPASLRLLVDDCTPERLSGLLSEQSGRIAVISPEGDFFDLIAGRYSENQARLGVYLRAHAGDNLRVDRNGERRTEYVQEPALTIGLAVQPEVLRGIAKRHELRGRGLLGRFLYCLPKSNIGYRDTKTISMSAEAEAGYHAGLRRLLELKPNMDTEEPRPHILNLSPEASSEFALYRAEVEFGLRPEGEMGDMTDWGGKLCGAVARLMGILHLAEHGLTNRIISRSTACAAMALGNYFIEHAKAAFDEMGADIDSDNARFVLDWVRRKGEGSFTRRDAHNGMQRRFKRATELDRPLDILDERGYIRERDQGRSASIRDYQRIIYDVHPVLLDSK